MRNLAHFLEQVPRLHRGFLTGQASREGEDLLDDVRATLGALGHHVEHAVHARVL